MNNRKLEICCYSVESALLAEEVGADRVELCDKYSEGGELPSSYGAVKSAIQNLSIPVNVIIRPRSGDFLYSEMEFETIKKDILEIRQLGANGIVIGFLTVDGDIDLHRTKEIIELAGPMGITFHRAFDMSKDPLTALYKLTDTGVDRILTSGSRNTVFEGVDQDLKRLGYKRINRPMFPLDKDMNDPDLSARFIPVSGTN